MWNEDGLFPGYMSIMSDDNEELEEERRLCYVAITRAMKKLTISYAKKRMVRGETQYNVVSRFVKEIPPLIVSSKNVEDRLAEKNSSFSQYGGGSAGVIRRGRSEEVNFGGVGGLKKLCSKCKKKCI